MIINLDGGAKGNKKRGLTKEGENLVKKLVDKSITIDLSHSNEKTFYDICNICLKLKQKGCKPKVIASHSNVKKICNHQRNLTDEQIKKIKELGGTIGVVGVKIFCDEKENMQDKYYKQKYIEHIKYIKNLLGSVKNIGVSSDDMTYYETQYYEKFNVFKQEKMGKELKELLLKEKFTEEEISTIMNGEF